MTQPKLGIIGAGYWGSNLVRNARELGVLAAVCDEDAARREQVGAENPGVEILERAADLFARPLDAVVIAAPAAQHEPLALAAIAAGKHVFVEKPLALTVEGGNRIAEAARAAGVVAFVGHLLLYHTGVVRLLDEIAAGTIGEVVHVRSRRLSLGRLRFEENVWWSFAPHDVALMLAIFDDEPVDVTGAQVGWTTPQICDFAYADFQFPRGRSAHIEVGWLDPAKSSRLDVFGTNGVLQFEDSRAGASLQLVPVGTRPTSDGRREIWQEPARELTFEKAEPLRAEMQAFLDCIVSRRQPRTSAEQGVRVLRALRRAERSTHAIDRARLEAVPV